MAEQICKNCRFFTWMPDYTNPAGECRRHAPRPTSATLNAVSHFPVVDHREWCGEFEPKRDPQQS